MPTPYTLPGATLHALQARELGRTYQLYVSTPVAPVAGRPLAAVYLTDPQWDFPLVTGILGNLGVDKAVPPCVVVGIGYPGTPADYEPLRARDLAAVPDPGGPAGPVPTAEGEQFLAFVAREVVPWAERTLGVDPARRVLLGSSLGGLFGLTALWKRPGLFQGVVAASPAAVWADGWVIRQAERAAAEGKPLDARLFVSGAEREWPAFLSAIRRLDAVIQSRPFAGLHYRFRLVDGERHCGTKAEAFSRGLREVMAPWAPEPSGEG